VWNHKISDSRRGERNFYVCEFHNGPPDYTRMNTGEGKHVVRNFCAAAV
jgi:hypothetical protein